MSLQGTLDTIGVTWRQSLSEVIVNNTELKLEDVKANRFPEPEPSTEN